MAKTSEGWQRGLGSAAGGSGKRIPGSLPEIEKFLRGTHHDAPHAPKPPSKASVAKAKQAASGMRGSVASRPVGGGGRGGRFVSS